MESVSQVPHQDERTTWRIPQHSGINHRPREEKPDGTSMLSHKGKLASDRALFTYSG